MTATAEQRSAGPSSSSSSRINTYHTLIPSPAPGIPAFVFHLTRLVDTLFIWVGVATNEEGAGDLKDRSDLPAAPTPAPVQIEGGSKLAGDWAVAMPSRGNIPITATPIYKSGAGDNALSMSQRLARRFPNDQIHLSLSLPTALTSQTPTSDPYASRHLLMMEKKLGIWLDQLLSQDKQAR